MAETEVERFWRETEERLGERVLLYSLGQYLSGCGDVRPGCWGLFFITEGALHFQTFPSQNWFSGLLRGFVRGKGAGAEGAQLEFVIPMASIREAALPKDPPIWRRVFAPAPPIVSVLYIDEDGREQDLRFSMDMKVKSFVGTLNGRIP